jgi:uncharacterized protein
MKILSVSDVEISFINSPSVVKRFPDLDFILGCGDLSYAYLEYIVSMLNIPLYYVRGNHAKKVEYGDKWSRHEPWGGKDLHRRCIKHDSGVLMAGIEGSVRYSHGPHQYSQGEMWLMVWSLVPTLFLNRLRYGRYLDIFVTHAPSWQIHDKEDLPHQGIKAFRWLVNVFQPALHVHGHIHLYGPDVQRESYLKNTRVVNTFGYQELELEGIRGYN